jgi:hypothetical protein
LIFLWGGAVEIKHPEAKHGGAPGKKRGRKKAKPANLASFAEDTAAATGMSIRTVTERGDPRPALTR